MRNPGGRFLILVAACILATSRLARAEETVKLETAKTEAATEVGATVCAGCHAERAEAFKKSWHGRKMPAMKNVPFEKSCESCHGPGSLHAAAGGDKSNPGFATTKISAESNERCLSCHNQRAVINWKVSAHNQQGLACAQCHKIHEGEGAPKPKSEVCLDCHKKKRMEINLPFHHPIIEGKMECAGCHNPHGGEFRNLNAESTRELCLKCHAEKAGPFAQEHPPVAEDCTICHMPHGSTNNNLLKQAVPNLCLTCHNAHHSDSPGYTTPVTAVKALATRQTCTNCHFKIHGSDDGSEFRH
ncbi:MAG: DmsE family decaheme c-type cytochrome [Elusimicrobia bacterium]|nr:DmsE family decaheme c-type cytochrome [Elusimicrobiota bacterium]